MASNVIVRPKQPVISKEILLFGSFAMISALAGLFVDEKAAEERRKQMVITIKQTVCQAFSQAQDVVAGSLASGLNALLQYVTHFLQAAGIQVGLHTVTPEGVIFVAEWVLLLLICYGLIALAFRLVTFILRWLWWVLKVGVALACFGLIMSNHSVDTGTMVIRLVCLGCVCILMSILQWEDRTMAARNAHLEKQMKILEKQVIEMGRWRRRCAILSCCLIALLGFVVCIAYGFYIVIFNSMAT